MSAGANLSLFENCRAVAYPLVGTVNVLIYYGAPSGLLGDLGKEERNKRKEEGRNVFMPEIPC
jgi:hypothetical protein